MNQTRAKEIWLAEDLSGYTRRQCRDADKFIKTYALRSLRNKLRKYPKAIRDYVQLMVYHHIGTIETDDFLANLGCYPDWMGTH